MAILPLDQAIPRFKGNEERFDKFVNGTALEWYVDDDNTAVPTIQKWLADKSQLIDEEFAGPVAQAQAAAADAQASAVSADASADAAQAILDEIQSTVAEIDEKIFTGDGVTATFTLDRAPGTDENVMVWVGGSIQDTSDYSTSGTTLTITPVVPNGIKVRTLILTKVSSNEMIALRDETLALKNDAEEAAVVAASYGAYNYPTEAAFLAANIPVGVLYIQTKGYTVLGDGGGHIKKRIATPGAPNAWQKQSADGAWWETVWEGAINLLYLGLKGDGSNETALFNIAVAAAESTGFRKIICKDPSKSFKVVQVEFTKTIEIDLNNGKILGDFGAWGNHSVSGLPIHWTKNVFFSTAVNAPSITLKNLTIDGQNDPNLLMAGGTPMVDFRGGATPGSVSVILDNVQFTKGANRIYTSGSGIAAPTAALDYRNQEVLLYNIDYVRMYNVQARSSPGEQVCVQSDDARTLFEIEHFYGTKKRDQNPTAQWSASSLNLFNCRNGSSLRNSRFVGHIKGPTNIETDGVLCENIYVDDVSDSNGLDCCEARTQRQNNFTFRNIFLKGIKNVGIRLAASNTIVENIVLDKVNIGVSYENGVSGSPSRGSWVKVDIKPLYNNQVRNITVLDTDLTHTDLMVVRCVGDSATNPIYVGIHGVGNADRPTVKPNFGIWAQNTHLSLGGYHGEGRTALIYLTGAVATVRGRDCQFAPEVGQGVHTFELNAVTLGKKAIVLDNVARLTALDSGWFDFRNTGSTLDLDAIHINGSPDFAGTTNNAVIHRDGTLFGSAAFASVGIPANTQVYTVVTVTGIRTAVNDKIISVCPSIVLAAGLVVSAQITASNQITVCYDNRTGATITPSAHTIGVYGQKANS